MEFFPLSTSFRPDNLFSPCLWATIHAFLVTECSESSARDDCQPKGLITYVCLYVCMYNTDDIDKSVARIKSNAVLMKKLLYDESLIYISCWAKCPI